MYIFQHLGILNLNLIISYLEFDNFSLDSIIKTPPLRDMAPSHETTPLAKSVAANGEQDSKPLSSFARNTINVLGYMRVLIGVGSLIAPLSTAKLFGIPLTPQTVLIGEMAAVRDAGLGELLLLADRKDKERKELKRMLWANIAIDSVDLMACGYGFVMGTLSKTAVVGFGSGAILFLGLGVAGLKSL